MNDEQLHAESHAQRTTRALTEYQLAAASLGPILDDIARIAARICSVPLAFIAMVGEYSAQIVGRYGTSATTLLANSTPFETTISAEGPYQLPDARLDANFQPDGMEFDQRRYRFFAAAPLSSPFGQVIGCIAVLDRRVGRLTRDQIEMLESLGHFAMTQLEFSRRNRNAQSKDRQRAAVEQSLTTERRFVSTVLDTIGAMVVVQDAEGRIVRFNRACEIISGYASSALVGQRPWDYLVPIEDAAACRLNFEHIRDGHFPASYEDTWIVADGSHHRIRWSATAMTEEAGAVSFIVASGIDITIERETEEQLYRLIRQSNSVLESVADGIMGLDLAGRITSINPAGAEMLGYAPDEMIGHRMHDLIHYAHADGSPYPLSESPVKRAFDQAATVRVSTEVFWCKDGNCIPVEYVARPQVEARNPSPLADRDSHVERIGIVLAFTDISERNAITRMKDEFISTMSHELRTPLTALRAPLGLIASGALSPERSRQMIQMAIENTDRLIRLVTDVLDLERIAAGTDPLHRTLVSLETLMSGCVMLLEESAARANVRLTVESNDVCVYADPDRISQLLTNLVANAIKFSPTPAPDLPPSEVRLTAHYGDRNEACIEVSDQGRGIPKEMLETVFSRFIQVDASDARVKGGSGLGLAICRSIVAQHHGRIWATSTPGHGSVFHVTLPAKESARLS